MMMELLIRRLRKHMPVFKERVAGAANPKGWVTSRALDLPHAFIVPTGTTVIDDGGGKRRAGSLTLSHNMQVIVYISGVGDERNQNAAQDIDEIRSRIIALFHGWQPDQGMDQLRFKQAQVGQQTREYSEWLFDFSLIEQFKCDAIADQRDQLDIEDLISRGGKNNAIISGGRVVIVPEDCNGCVGPGIASNIPREEASCL